MNYRPSKELRLLYRSDIDIVIVCSTVREEHISTFRQILTLCYKVGVLPVRGSLTLKVDSRVSVSSATVDESEREAYGVNTCLGGYGEMNIIRGSSG